MIERQGWQRTRSTDPVTSREAADSVTDKLRESQAAVLRVFRAFGSMTDEVLVWTYAAAQARPEQSPSGLRTRRHELVDAGLLEDTGERNRLVSGRRAIVWGVPLTEGERATPEGLRAADHGRCSGSPSVSGSSLFAADSGDSKTPESDPLICSECGVKELPHLIRCSRFMEHSRIESPIVVDPGQMTIEEARCEHDG